MNPFFIEVFEQLEADLKKLEEGEEGLRRYEGAVELLQGTIVRLKKALLEDVFVSKQAEIFYFKEQAPKVYGQLFLYMTLMRIESMRQHISAEKFLEMLEEEMATVEEFSIQHRDVIQYTSRNNVYWTEHLFMRKDQGEWSSEEIGTYIDVDFTIGTYWMSWLYANTALRVFLMRELQDLGGIDPGDDPGVEMVWTANIVDLVELGYSLHLARCFNHGKATLKDVMDWLERKFKVRVGKYHIIFSEIGRRKTGRTKFLNLLIDKVTEKMDELLG